MIEEKFVKFEGREIVESEFQSVQELIKTFKIQFQIREILWEDSP